MTKFFFTEANGKQSRPHSKQELQALIERRVITADTPLETDTGHKGLAGKVPGLNFNIDESQDDAVPVAKNEGHKTPLPRNVLVVLGIVILVLICFGILNFGGELRILRGHKKGVDFASFSPDGKKIVTTSKDETSRIWDANSGRTLRTFEVGAVCSAIFSPDGKKIVTANYGHGARIWDTESGQQLQTLAEGTRMR